MNEIKISRIILELTNRCFLNCQGCKVRGEQELSLRDIKKVMEFAKTAVKGYLNITLSGREPLLHSNFPGVLDILKDQGCNYITLGTNGFLLNEKHIEKLREFEQAVVIFMLDSLKGATSVKTKSSLLDLLEMRIKNISCMVKMIAGSEGDIPIMSEVLKMARNNGCDGVIFSTQIPDWPLSKTYKDFYKHWLDQVAILQNQYLRSKTFLVLTPDPLARVKCPAQNFPCPIGKSFTVMPEGKIIPCGSFRMEVGDIARRGFSFETFANNSVIQTLTSGILKGKCLQCLYKELCGGGCFARSALTGNDLNPDPACPY
ncbi:MAG: radical SAM protein [bacterium]